jgi:hypothetical protein
MDDDQVLLAAAMALIGLGLARGQAEAVGGQPR